MNSFLFGSLYFNLYSWAVATILAARIAIFFLEISRDRIVVNIASTAVRGPQEQASLCVTFAFYSYTFLSSATSPSTYATAGDSSPHLLPLEVFCIIVSINAIRDSGAMMNPVRLALCPLIAEHRTSSIGIDSSAPARTVQSLALVSDAVGVAVQLSTLVGRANVCEFEFEMLVLKSRISDLRRSNSATFE
ncbi:hypothetical protein BDZ97DRAFT_1927445 [Flammula alnicola]|nr:hypothetical protein BDZ97DRAFT_1927445 [Flammula alnicola]